MTAKNEVVIADLNFMIENIDKLTESKLITDEEVRKLLITIRTTCVRDLRVMNGTKYKSFDQHAINKIGTVNIVAGKIS